MGTRIKCGTNNIFFVKQSAVPADRKVSYCRLVSSLRPNKVGKRHVRVTAGGNLLECSNITSTDTASLTTIKCLLNSVISTPDTEFTTANIKYFYYGSPPVRDEYARMHLADIPDQLVEQYNVRAILKK